MVMLKESILEYAGLLGAEIVSSILHHVQCINMSYSNITQILNHDKPCSNYITGKGALIFYLSTIACKTLFWPGTETSF